MNVSTNKRGTAELVDLPFSAYRHFEAMSNELSTPKILLCPSDRRTEATNWASLGNDRISYFVGINASENFPKTFLSGDRHLTNWLKPTNGFLELRRYSTRWLPRLHTNFGHIAFADGAVTALPDAGLRKALAETGDATNRIALPTP
ncbi:MAG: hypothetical protein FJ403_05945 [Verrucomicrobia bacterium]|nr:hypothetical protein [Verrucomicrobiota bacterium]